MAIVRKLLARVGGIGGFLATTDSALVAANATTDNDFTESIGRKADTAVNVVGTGASLIAYIKGLVGGGATGIGTTFFFTKDYTTGQVTTAGVTLATATGAVFIKSISCQGTAITSSSDNLILTSNDTSPGACARFLYPAGIAVGDFLTLLNGTNAAGGLNHAKPIGHILATTKVLTLKAQTAALAGTGLRVVLECVRNTANASLA